MGDPTIRTNIMDALGLCGRGYSLSGLMMPFAPSQVRSRFAAFDPGKVGSSDLLAGLGPLGALAGLARLLPGKDDERPEKVPTGGANWFGMGALTHRRRNPPHYLSRHLLSVPAVPGREAVAKP
jgi:hypothetical protein